MDMLRVVHTAKSNTLLRSSLSLYRESIRNQRVEPDILQAQQNQLAIAHARFAMQNTVFYRDRYKAAGFNLADLSDPAAFTELPIIEKSDVREHFASFHSKERTNRNSLVSTSGGSTGEPLKLLRDLRFPARALEWRLFDWWGVNPYDHLGVVYRHFRTARQTVRQNLGWWPSKRIELNASDMTSAATAEFINRWQRIQPGLLIGYVGGVAELATYCRKNGIIPSSPKAIAVTAAPLTQAQRDLISETFRAPVFDHYRSAEVPWLAGECSEHNGLHIFADYRKVELLDPDDNAVQMGTTGEVVATDFTNRVFPLIRYRLGDRSSPLAGTCPCGVNLPRITPIAGRVSDALHLPDGQVVPGEGLTQLCSAHPDAIRQFQIHQHKDHSVTLRLVLAGTPGDEAKVNNIVQRLRTIVHDQVSVRLQIVDVIAHDRGKTRYITSDVNTGVSSTEHT